jgi:hypothetical protein
MKAKLVFACILTLLVFGLSSCFIKKFFKQREHQMDHRGYYIKMGRHAQYYPSKGERIRRHKRHSKRYKRKEARKRHQAALERIQNVPDTARSRGYQINWKDSNGRDSTGPAPQMVMPQQGPADTMKVAPPPEQVAPKEQSVTPPPPEQPEKQKKKKKSKQKKTNDTPADQPVPADQGPKSDTTGQK